MNPQAALDALTEQVECCRKLAKLSRMQHEHITHGRVEQLLDVLKSRQQVVEQMSACERVVGPVKKQWETFVTGLDQVTRTKAETLLAQSRSLLETITASDQDDALVLQQRRLNLGKEIRQTSSARQVHRMYGAAAYGHRPPRMDVQR
jgi:hypothetical protein